MLYLNSDYTDSKNAADRLDRLARTVGSLAEPFGNLRSLFRSGVRAPRTRPYDRCPSRFSEPATGNGVLTLDTDVAGSTTIYLDPTGEFPWQDRADLPITTLAEIAAML